MAKNQPTEAQKTQALVLTLYFLEHAEKINADRISGRPVMNHIHSGLLIPEAAAGFPDGWNGLPDQKELQTLVGTLEPDKIWNILSEAEKVVAALDSKSSGIQEAFVQAGKHIGLSKDGVTELLPILDRRFFPQLSDAARTARHQL